MSTGPHGLPFPLEAFGPDGRWEHTDGVLTGRAGARQDRFVPPGGDSLESVSDAPRLLGAAPEGDFRLSARVTVDFAAAFDAGVLYLHAGDQEWAKLCMELSPELPTICSVITRGHSDDANSSVVDGNSVWLRLSRTGDAYAFHASDDGEKWTFVRTFALGAPERKADVRIGFLVQSPTGEGCRAAFDHIALLPGGLADLRDGS
ncbi:DUF1349 domain-containing protein [Streptomyces nitrosporeus]|uniref:DUF1349 domain-containing protein n=1 Tax=Streptomyces nitrosporeus TaxID=28894 RepID=A0A5J6FGG2_9ACTN|nr:DUF1349 domain-containing protein [Streptomyces nitrosporeus]QEU75131.1 DUF1349 domain-containing protein [Streptomyces nitrosporeus]GGY90589.1 hypothetical protein GCM10010327_21630 [Streptomyces nitrosporeus]